MVVFEYVLILLAAVLLSNLVNRFIPALSVPVLQLILGVIIALIPFGAFGFEFELEPELFFVLFIAPVIFHTSMTADKKTLWELKVPIVGSAMLLVVITVLVGGYMVYALVPAISLAGAFVLISALGPTDYVAVDAVEKRVNIPHDIMSILSGESYINDASGIVCFQFAVAAVVTGSFSAAEAAGQFLLVGLGGVAAGLVLTLFKYGLVRWLRIQGVENVTLHSLVGLLTPFIVYIAAEALGVSGILAVFASGIAHSFARDQLNPETAGVYNELNNVWSVMTFTFEGLVFVMLGTQLPGILTAGDYIIPVGEIVFYIVIITLIMAALRVVWWVVIDGSVSAAQKSFSEKIKSGAIYGLAGARGTVSLASAMAIPLVLSDGSPFPGRDLIILLVSGVIVASLLITNFILPKLTEQKTEPVKNAEEQEAYAEIIQKVTASLLSEATEENRAATEIVARSYYSRRAVTMRGMICAKTPEDNEMQTRVLLWEKENTLALLGKGSVNETVANHFIRGLDARLASSDKPKIVQKALRIAGKLQHFKQYKRNKDDANGFRALIGVNALYVLKKLKEIRNEENAKTVDKFIASYELSAAFHTVQNVNREKANRDEPLVYEIAAKGFGIGAALFTKCLKLDAFQEKRLRICAAKSPP